MLLDPLQCAAALASGALIGAILSLLGAGGSILAVPLLVFFVGVRDPHTAIGTGAAAVAANALIALYGHARRGNVRWPCGLVFAGAGVIGAFFGTLIGKALDGQRLMTIFGLVMIVVGLTSLRGGPEGALASGVRMTRENAPQMAPRLLGAGLGVGAASGFFGIGGGFLIVPALMAAAGLAMSVAMGTSLVAVAAFGLTALSSYAWSGFVDWPIALLMTTGGALGAAIGGLGAQALSKQRKLLGLVFAGVVIVTGASIVWRGWLGMS